MYVALVLAQTVVLPLVSAAIELLLGGGDPILVLGRWFLFWAVGTRLLVAGLSQIIRPGFTARSILGIQDPAAEQVVQELGFTNATVGIMAMLAVAVAPAWSVPVAIIGGSFLGLAGIRHVLKPGLDRNELVATWTDLLVAAVMIAFVIRSALG